MNSAPQIIATRATRGWRSGAKNKAHVVQRLLDQLASTRADLHHELSVVGDIQRSLLPERLPDIPGFDLASYYRPCAMAGGDYFDIVPLVDDAWGLVIADVAGHGVSATVIMAVMRALVHAHLPHTRYMPSNVFLRFMNRQMSTYTPGGRFVTVWCAVLEPRTRRLTYASAGHNPPRLLRGGSVLPLNEVGGVPLGVNPTEVYEEVTVTLEPDDLLMIYTDGITEATRNEHEGKELFGTERLDQILVEASRDSAQDCLRRVTSAVNKFSETDVPTDDQTMLVIRVNQN